MIVDNDNKATVSTMTTMTIMSIMTAENSFYNHENERYVIRIIIAIKTLIAVSIRKKKIITTTISKTLITMTTTPSK